MYIITHAAPFNAKESNVRYTFPFGKGMLQTDLPNNKNWRSILARKNNENTVLHQFQTNINAFCFAPSNLYQIALRNFLHHELELTVITGITRM